MEWSNELIFEFLLLYRNEPTLWNTHTAEHKNKIDAHEAWRRIKENLRDGTIPIREIKKKRDNLMSTYRRQSRRVRESMEPDSGEDVFKPEWPFYTIMASFLDRIYKPKCYRRFDDIPELEEIREEFSAEDDEKLSKFKTPNVLQKRPLKRVKLNDYDETRKCGDETHTYYQEYRPNQEADTCNLYCNLLCSKLRALKENTRDIAMMEIDRIIYNLKQQDQQTIGAQYQNIIPSIIQPGYCHSPAQYLPPVNHNRHYSRQLKQEQEGAPSPGSQSPQQILVQLSPTDFHVSNSQSPPQRKDSSQSRSNSHSPHSQSSPLPQPPESVEEDQASNSKSKDCELEA